MDWRYLEGLRKVEGDLALAKLRAIKPPPAQLVEIGGGSGWQAQQFVTAGYQVQSFDLAVSSYKGTQMFPVRDYDGHHLPLADASSDILFSSNVLEHIAHIREFQAELLRVLKPDGVALHILPTAAWRLWTTACHYPGMVKLAVAGRTEVGGSVPTSQSCERSSVASRIVKHIVPRRHGEVGNAMTELYYFSRHRWTRLFEETGWRVAAYDTNRLAYTGFSLLNDRVSLDVRRRMSRLVGSSCHIFLLRRESGSPQGL